MKKSISLYLITVLAVASTAVSCFASPPKYHPGGPYYYKSWANYYLPYRPVDEISKPDADELERQGYAYYVAFFNEQGLIKSFEKRYQGKTDFKVTYYYENGLLKKEEGLDANGKVKVTLYDKNGKWLKQ